MVTAEEKPLRSRFQPERSLCHLRAGGSGRKAGDGRRDSEKTRKLEGTECPDVSTSGWILGDKLAEGVARPADKKGTVVESR